MPIEELWEKIQHELGEIKTDIKEVSTKTDRLEENVQKLNEKTDRLEENVERLNVKTDKLETDVKELHTKTDRLEENVERLNVKTDRLEENVEQLNVKTENLDKKVNTMANVNLAKILEQQTLMRQELNDKINQYMLRNNLEHKQYAYQIANLESKNGIVTKIG